jgi:hypothetical protein
MTKVAKQIMIQDIKERSNLVAKMERNNKDNMFAYVESKLSKESLDEVKCHRDYEVVKNEVDPLKLWMIVKELHTVTTSSRVEAVVKRKTWEEYAMCKQGVFKSLMDYKAKFNVKYESYVAQDNPEKSEEDQAIEFLEGLDKSRYGKFIVEVINNIVKGSMQPLKTVNEVFILTNTRLIVKRGNNYNVGASYVTIESSRLNSERRSRHNNGKSGKSSRGRKTKGSKDKNVDSDDKKSNKEEKRKKWFKNAKCFNCGRKGHLACDCDQNDSGDENGDDDETPLAGIAIEEYVSKLCLHSGEGAKPKRHKIILDSGSEVNCVHLQFLVDIRDTVSGFKGLLGDETKLTKIGTLVGFFDCLSSDKMQASILSLVDVEDMYPVLYIQGKSYTIHLLDCDLVFKRRGSKLYLGDFSDWINQGRNESYMSLMTTREREHLYTKKEVQKVRDA